MGATVSPTVQRNAVCVFKSVFAIASKTYARVIGGSFAVATPDDSGTKTKGKFVRIAHLSQTRAVVGWYHSVNEIALSSFQGL